MKKLKLPSLEIKNFRVFKELEINQLGQVNLIVGKNNVGKTTILEALRIYAARDHASIWNILSERDEGDYPSEVTSQGVQTKINTLRKLFHGRYNIPLGDQESSIGEARSRYNRIKIEFNWRSVDEPEQVRPRLTIRPGTGFIVVDNLDRDFPAPSDEEQINHTYIPSIGLNRQQVELLWSKVALTEDENRVIEALNIVTKDVCQLGIISNPDLGMLRVPVARLKGVEEPIPVQSMGDGINRLFYISLALVNARNGLLLIDEVGSGLHYSVQLQLWNLIFSIAESLNVQVFATTHSNDCIYAFQLASRESLDNGVLIRLENRKGLIVPIIFDEDRLAKATREQIEVR